MEITINGTLYPDNEETKALIEEMHAKWENREVAVLNVTETAGSMNIVCAEFISS